MGMAVMVADGVQQMRDGCELVDAGKFGVFAFNT